MLTDNNGESRDDLPRWKAFILGFGRILDLSGSFYAPHGSFPPEAFEESPTERASKNIHRAWKTVGAAMYRSMNEADVILSEDSDDERQQRLPGV